MDLDIGRPALVFLNDVLWHASFRPLAPLNLYGGSRHEAVDGCIARLVQKEHRSRTEDCDQGRRNQGRNGCKSHVHG